MFWRISEREFLIRGKSYHIYLSLSVNRVRLPDGTLMQSGNEYFRVSAGGEVLMRYGDPWSSSVEDYLYVSGIHAVVQSSLYKFLWIEGFGYDSKLGGEGCIRGVAP